MKPSKAYEVIVVGGGMIGAVTACILGQAGIEVALLDAYKPPLTRKDDTIDLRVSALTKASENILTAIGVWEKIKQRGACAYREMKVWDGQGEGFLHFDCAQTQYPELGHIVENRVTVASVWEALADLPRVDIVIAKVQEMHSQQGQRYLTLEDGSSVYAPLIIAADGRDSFLRKKMGIDVTGWEYHQHGLVATISTENSHQNTAWQRFLPEGPLAFLPLYNGQSSIVWTLKTETAKAYLELNEEEFLQKLHQASDGLLGNMLSTSNRASFALRFQYANRYIDNGFALIGDAAHAMHPLAGQGANAGLLDAAAIAELIIDAKKQRKPYYSHKLLRRYERWRKGDNLLMMTSMDVLNKTYAVGFEPFVKLRSTGMNWINHNVMLKNYFNYHAMGLRDDLPKLAQKLI